MPTFALPDLGEGLTEGEVIRWLVAAGDRVAVNQPLVEVETAKASVELPSPYAGLVTALHAAAGDTVDVGAPLISVATDDEPPVLAAQAPREAVLVGYGVRSAAPALRRPRLDREAVPTAPDSARRPTAPGLPAHALAKPPVRKLAKELGLDLRQVPGSGPGGVVTRADVTAAGADVTAAGAGVTAAHGLAGAAGGAARIPVTGMRRAMAGAMVASAQIPQATVFLRVDATETVRLVRRWRERPEFADVRVTALLVAAKALLAACRRHPEVTARWDEAAGELVIPGAVNLGLAVATDRGLVVPNIKSADGLGTLALARAIADLTDTARAGRTGPAELRGGTVTLTNIGSFGMDSGTPLLNPGETAILALGSIRERPWVDAGELVVRSVVDVALTFDHRLVDGRLGAAVLSDIGAALEDPAQLLLWS